MRSVKIGVKKSIDKGLVELRALNENHQDFKNELEQAVQELIDGFKDSHGMSHSDYVEKMTGIKDEIDESVSNIMSSIEDYADNRTIKWQESENGCKYRTWYEQWSDFSHAIYNAASIDEEITVSLSVGSSGGLDPFTEVPDTNVCEVEASYRCW